MRSTFCTLCSYRTAHTQDKAQSLMKSFSKIIITKTTSTLSSSSKINTSTSNCSYPHQVCKHRHHKRHIQLKAPASCHSTSCTSNFNSSKRQARSERQSLPQSNRPTIILQGSSSNSKIYRPISHSRLTIGIWWSRVANRLLILARYSSS